MIINKSQGHTLKVVGLELKFMDKYMWPVSE